ncbi:AMP-binding protein [Streptomyces sp. NPDC058401]|uniref:AMP-binding protein n=1 Tax=Streptomyces sp. NPDC058401 TaxID=3346480 RepID=UPI00364CC620
MSSLKRLSDPVHAVAVIARTGLIDPLRPDLILRLRWDLRNWGPAAAVRGAARRWPARIALVDERGALTYRQLDQRSDALCEAWRARGLGGHSVIAVLCRDHRGLLEAMFAGGKLGARVLMMNTGFSGPQFADVAEREGVSAAVFDEEFAAVTELLPAPVHRMLAWTDSGRPGHPTLESMIESAPGARLRPPASVGSLVMLTSGTTGLPKGAPRQVRSLSIVLQLLERVPWRKEESTFIASPLFHGTGMAHAVVMISLGSRVVLRRRFDPEQTLSALAANHCTGMVVVPTMLHRILALGPERLAAHDLSRLRIVLAAGSALAPGLTVRALDAFGEVLYNLYGSTEVATATVATPDELRAAPGTTGRTPRGCRVGLYGPDGRPVAGPGVRGRVFVANSQRFDSYTDGRSKEVIDGLMSTGDVGHFDADGLLFIDGRDDDMIVSGGENVFPGEIENLICGHEAVHEAAVVGVEDEEFGRRLKAYVVTIPGRDLTADDVRAYVRANLARHKVPRDVVFLPELPRTPTGKLLRRSLT